MTVEEEKKMKGRPRVNSEGQTELDKTQNQLEEFENQIKDLTLDRMNMAPRKETEPQTKLSQKEISESKDVYLKANRCFFSREKFNEKFRSDWDFAKEYVYFIAENNEVKGEAITMWTKTFPGVPCEEWIVPVNKPVWAPRYVAEQIKRASYHQLKMDESETVGQNRYGYDTGRVVVDSVVQRLDARPATKKKSLFLGASGF